MVPEPFSLFRDTTRVVDGRFACVAIIGLEAAAFSATLVTDCVAGELATVARFEKKPAMDCCFVPLDVVAGFALVADDLGVAISLPSIPRAMMPTTIYQVVILMISSAYLFLS
jgi:hypothetical protein